MDPISGIGSLTPAPQPKPASLNSRVLSSANDEMKQLLQMAAQSLASPTLGTKIDVRA